MTQNITTDNDEIDLAELFHALWAHKISIGFCTVFAIFCAGYYALTTDKEFTAKAVFEIQQGDNGRSFNLPGDLGALASLARVRGDGTSGTDALLERVKSKEFILETNDVLNFGADPYFNNDAPNQTDPLWKATIKNLIGWQSDERAADAIIENKIVGTFKEVVSVSTTDAGAISLSVTHGNPERAAFGGVVKITKSASDRVISSISFAARRFITPSQTNHRAFHYHFPLLLFQSLAKWSAESMKH